MNPQDQKSRLGVGWVILGLAAVLVIILAVNGTLATRFHGFWTWVSTIGHTAPTHESVMKRIVTSPTIGGPNSPILNPIGLWHQIIVGLGG